MYVPFGNIETIYHLVPSEVLSNSEDGGVHRGLALGMEWLAMAVVRVLVVMAIAVMGLVCKGDDVTYAWGWHHLHILGRHEDCCVVCTTNIVSYHT